MSKTLGAFVDEKSKKDYEVRKRHEELQRNREDAQEKFMGFLLSKLKDKELQRVLDFYRDQGFNAMQFCDNPREVLGKVYIGPKVGIIDQDTRENNALMGLSFYEKGMIYGMNYLSAFMFAERQARNGWKSLSPEGIEKQFEKTLDILRHGEELRDLGEVRISDRLRSKYLTNILPRL